MLLYVAVFCVTFSLSASTNQLMEDAIVKYLSTNEALQGKAEIVFLLDRSGSVGAAHFEEEKGFVESFLTHIVVDVNATRVAVISYSDTTKRHIDYLQSPKTKCILSQEMQDVVFKDSGATNIAAALDEAYEVFRNARPNINKVLVLISDGLATRGGDPVPYAQRLKNSGVEIFCFGIGRALESELELLASSKQHVFSSSGFREFKRLARRIRGDPHEMAWSGGNKPNCDHLCDSPYRGESIDPGCCDHEAVCSCALRSGIHTCVCGPGYYGLSGLMGECKACPVGTYKSKLEPTRSCTPCPGSSTTMKLASTSIKDCVCKEGYTGNPANGIDCKKVTCPPLQPPTHGFILGICEKTYGSECHFMCEDGYELLNKMEDIRVCQKDGTWSGKMSTCGIVRCPALPAPRYGRKYCEADANMAAGTKCKFNCLAGFTLHGSETRECLPTRHWSGTAATCQPITCNTPPPLAHGRIINCDYQKKPELFQTCLYQCNSGFELKGTYYLTCRENGKLLDGYKKESKPICVDVTPPDFPCSAPVWVSASKGRNGTTVSWKIHYPTDNSGFPPKLYTTPYGITSPSYFNIGAHTIKYTAVDTSGLESHCDMKIVVTDDEPPTVMMCPRDIEISTNSYKEIVTWKKPWFEDNSGKPLKITQTAYSGQTFSIGTHTVSYKAVDENQNEESCVFNILVKRVTCPYYPPPANGAFTCNDWLHGKMCQTYCNSKHEFTEKPAKWYICNSKAQWQTIPNNYPVPWPDCARQTIPTKVKLMLSGFYYHGSCNNENVQRDIKKMFMSHLQTLKEAELCVDKGTCSFKTVKVQCGKEMISSPRRHKRDVWEYAEKEELELEFEITINVDHELNDTEAVLQNFLETIQKLNWELSEDLNFQTTTIDPVSNLYESNQNMSLTGKLVLTDDKTFFECKPGSVLNDNICVSCAPGTFYDNSTQECWDCPLGHFQELEGQLSCSKCPDGMSTLYRRSRNQTDCRSICLSGTYSPTGLETCMACPIGTYQEHVGQKMCDSCPELKTTASLKSTSFSNCKDICKPGTFSESGVVPCAPCFRGYYQSLSGQTKCIECPANFSTVNSGSTNSDDCEDLDPCSTQDICQNGGQCKRVGRDAMCICKSGYEGVHCENDVNECEMEPCFNDGYCMNVEGSFYCNCTNGFAGSLCEEEFNECSSSPCLNGGTCSDKVNDYECFCAAGYDGSNCEIKLEVCYHDIICLNGGLCTIDAETNNTFCECKLGYDGIDCSVDIDECVNITCLNNGSCIDDIASYKCACTDGFTGPICEIDIDDCLGNQCSSGSTCEDLIGSYKCVCPPGYSGIYCEIRLDDDFILNFPESAATIANMATMTLKSPMSDVTVSMWVQTNDTNHAGTPLSYAVASTSSTDETGNVVDNALTISDCSGLHVYVNNEPLVTDVQVADGQWHHLAFTWSSEDSGKWVLFKDGKLQSEGKNLQPNSFIREGGTMVIGQEQDEVGGGFSPMETFVGNITRVNVWNEYFSKSNITRLCNIDDDIPGKVVAWPDFLQGLKGNINVIKNEKPFVEIKNNL